MARESVARVAEVPPGTGKACSLGGKPVALFNVDGSFHAVDNTCAHRGGPLAEGHLDGTTVTCPWHGWQFDVTSGACTMNPAVQQQSFTVTVEGDEVFIED